MALTYTHLTVANSNADPQTSGSVSPTAGGVLLLFVTSSTQGVTYTIGGTLTGTWNVIDTPRNVSGNARYAAAYWCSNYGASGTISVDGSGATSWTTFTVTHVAEAGILNTSNPVKQYKFFDHGAANLSTSFDAAPVYGTWVGASTNGLSTAGTGYTNINNDTAWAALLTMKSATGTQLMAATVGSPFYTGWGVELNKISLGRSAGIGPIKSGWRR